MRSISVICLLFALGSAVSAQRLLTGSADARMQALEERANWNAAKKISLAKVEQAGPRPGALREHHDKQIGHIEQWDYSVLQIIDANNMLLVVGRQEPIWLEGYPTKEFADGDQVRVLGDVLIDGKKKYMTPLGVKKTVWRFQLLTDEMRKEMSFREWKSANGKYSTEAVFLDFRDGKVVLEKRDGKTVSMRPEALSREDIQHYRAVLKERRRAK